jgi:putative ABC transport system substrate-binding protein
MNNRKIIIVLIAIAILILPGAVLAQDTEYTIGVFSFYPDPIKAKMAELGYVEGENVTYLIPSWEGWDTMTAEEYAEVSQQRNQAVIDARPDVLIVNTDSDAVSYFPTTGDMPIVFAISDNPVATGAVADLVTPGGTATGMMSNNHHERRLQLLTEIDPSTKHVYYLYFPLTLESETILQGVRDLADELGIEITAAPVVDLASGLEALANTPEDVDWLFLTPYVPFDAEFLQELNTVSAAREAAIAGFIFEPYEGHLIGYGPDLAEAHAQTAVIVDRILRGASPADLPIQITENRLIVNLEAAEALQIDVPVNILQQADMIVRPGYFDAEGE